MILSASSHMRNMEPNRYQISIDLKPALSLEQLDTRLQKILRKNQNKDFINSLGALLPRKLIPIMVAKSGIATKSKCNQITKEQRRRFAQELKGFKVMIKDFVPLMEAIITSRRCVCQRNFSQDHGIEIGKRTLLCGRSH